ncbi:MAG: hypothetical protein M1819_000358 [Sarea resinae]|nr:MAG: hypothetical protein M1819_000358 [Sarea resinae]
MAPKLTAPSVCLRCLARRNYSSSTKPSALPPHPLSSGATKLSNRRLIALHGQDASRFLQGITTNNIRPGQTTGFYSAFLNAQGRVLNDVFIYPSSHSSLYTNSLPASLSPDEPAYMIEVDAAEASKLVAHLKRHKLRAKVSIRAIEPGEWDVWSVWNEQDRWTPHAAPASSPEPSSSNASPDAGYKDTIDTIGCPDSRAPGMGQRILLPHTDRPAILSTSATPEASLTDYTIRRMLRGVAEGQREILRETSLPQESNIDYMGGIDFRKGCYTGQELTIRTHHTGVVRKRILPVLLYDSSALSSGTSPGGKSSSSSSSSAEELQLQYDPSTSSRLSLPPQGTNISRVNARGRSTGKYIAGVGNVGLALCRLEMMTDIVLTGETGQWAPGTEFKLSWSSDAYGSSGETGEGAPHEQEHGRGRGQVGSEEEQRAEERKGEREEHEVRIKAFVPSWHPRGGGFKNHSSSSSSSLQSSSSPEPNPTALKQDEERA